MPQERFAEVATEAILSLPQDLKAALRVVEDADVDDASRVAVAGAILHVLSNANAIPGTRGVLAHVGNVIVLRLVLERAIKASPEAMAAHQEDSPELFGPLPGQLEATRSYLTDLIGVLDKVADGVVKLSHQGHSAEQCARDMDESTWLYEAVQEAIVERLELDEDEVAREMKQVDTILPHLRSRMS
ncbi:MAG: hypothetical protein KC416_03650 [Myxococcales bacterium]|nr:hypothetical protein [Myxococcales bacterium]